MYNNPQMYSKIPDLIPTDSHNFLTSTSPTPSTPGQCCTDMPPIPVASPVTSGLPAIVAQSIDVSRRSQESLDNKNMTDVSGNANAVAKICRVCGDRALGYNFNVVSCESCKAFFRRNALRKKDFHCPFEEHCEVNAVSRRFCQKCRLKKCFQVGMKKEWIMTDDALMQKRLNRQRRKTGTKPKSEKRSKLDLENEKVSSSDAETSNDIPFPSDQLAFNAPNKIISPMQDELSSTSTNRNKDASQLSDTSSQASDLHSAGGRYDPLGAAEMGNASDDHATSSVIHSRKYDGHPGRSSTDFVPAGFEDKSNFAMEDAPRVNRLANIVPVSTKTNPVICNTYQWSSDSLRRDVNDKFGENSGGQNRSEMMSNEKLDISYQREPTPVTVAFSLHQGRSEAATSGNEFPNIRPTNMDSNLNLTGPDALGFGSAPPLQARINTGNVSMEASSFAFPQSSVVSNLPVGHNSAHELQAFEYNSLVPTLPQLGSFPHSQPNPNTDHLAETSPTLNQLQQSLAERQCFPGYNFQQSLPNLLLHQHPLNATIPMMGFKSLNNQSETSMISSRLQSGLGDNIVVSREYLISLLSTNHSSKIPFPTPYLGHHHRPEVIQSTLNVEKQYPINGNCSDATARSTSNETDQNLLIFNRTRPVDMKIKKCTCRCTCGFADLCDVSSRIGKKLTGEYMVDAEMNTIHSLNETFICDAQSQSSPRSMTAVPSQQAIDKSLYTSPSVLNSNLNFRQSAGEYFRQNIKNPNPYTITPVSVPNSFNSYHHNLPHQLCSNPNAAFFGNGIGQLANFAESLGFMSSDNSFGDQPPGCPTNRGLFGAEDMIFGGMLDAAIDSEFSSGFGEQSVRSVDSGVLEQEGEPSPATVGVIKSPASQSLQLRVLTPYELSKLQELLSSNEVMKKPLEKLVASKQSTNQRLIDVINLTDVAIKRIIKMSKQISGFQTMCQEDQIALLKGGCTEIMILRGVMAYDPEKNSWEGPGFQSIKVEILKEVKGLNVYEEHQKYLHSFKASWRTSESIMLLLGAITLFTPERQNVINASLIKKEQDLYYKLLRKYLESIYHIEEAEITFNHLVRMIHDLHRLNDNATRIFLDVNPKDVEPLLIEIFDLK